jgi:hypothetical protein
MIMKDLVPQEVRRYQILRDHGVARLRSMVMAAV